MWPEKYVTEVNVGATPAKRMKIRSVGSKMETESEMHMTDMI